jgi:phenylacetate-CoA ligase
MAIDRAFYLNSFSMSDEKISNFVDTLNKSKPQYIQGYASSLYLVAKHISQTKPLKFKPIAIRSAAEMLYDFQRDEIEKAFAAPVYNFYGSREIGFLASECSAHEGLHVLDSGRIIEIVDEKGQPLPDGEPGYLAITDLFNMAFPFIRYINGDIATYKDQPCSCGRGYKLLENILGRSSDIITINEQYIHGEFFTHLFYGHPDIKQFQLIQETQTHLRLLIVSDKEDLNTGYFRDTIIERVGGNIKLDIIITDHIPVLSTGKYRFTVSKLTNGP